MKKKVSIIIPVYNVEKYIIKCLSSVYSQSYSNIEIILIDDKGNDFSMQKISEFYYQHPEYKYQLISQEINSGLSAARNSGLKNATGDYVFFLDSDDILPEYSILELIKSAEKYNSDVVIGDLICIEQKSGNKKYPFPLKVKLEFLSGNENIFNSLYLHEWPVIAPNKLYKKSFLEDNQLTFKEGLLHEDELWAFEWTLKAERVSIVDKITYNYIFHESSIISNKKEKNTDDLILISKLIYEYFLKEDNKQKKKQIYEYFIWFSEQNLRIIFQHIPDKKYFKKSYSEIRKIINLSLLHYLQMKLSFSIIKLIVLMRLPDEIGYRVYRYRFNRQLTSFFKN